MRPYCTHRCHYPPGHRPGPQAVKRTAQPADGVSRPLLFGCAGGLAYALLSVGFGVAPVPSLVAGAAWAGLVTWANRRPSGPVPTSSSSGSFEPSGVGVAAAWSDWGSDSSG